MTVSAIRTAWIALARPLVSRNVTALQWRLQTMTPDDFRRMALALDGAEEGSHMGSVDFRVGGRIFATLASVDEGFGNLMLTPEVQEQLVADAPEFFVPIRGGWGRMGATHVRLASVPSAVLEGALRTAWKLRIHRNAATKGGRASRTRRAPGGHHKR